MKIKLHLRKLVCLALIINIIFVNELPSFVSASSGDGDADVHHIYNRDGEITTTITMENGKISIITNAHGATNSIKWRAIGYCISLEPLAPRTYNYVAEEGTYQLKGWQDMNTVEYTTLYFNEASVVSESRQNDGMVITTREFSKDKVEGKLLEKFGEVPNNAPIYLHYIFQTYKGNEIRKSEIRNWLEIVKAEWWDRSDNQLDDFSYLFNMRIDFKPGKQTTTLYYKDGETLDDIRTKKELEKVYPGKSVSWSNEPATIKKTASNGEAYTYELYGYYITKANSKIKLRERQLGGSITLSDLQNGTITNVRLGGMNVYLLYRKVNSNNIVINAVDLNDNVIRSKIYEGTVKPGEPFNKSLDSTIIVSGKTYKKTVNYYYTYKNNNNDTVKKAMATAKANDKISFSIPTSIKNGSTLTVNVYYKVEEGNIPVTINAVNKATGAIIETKADTVVGGGDFTDDISEKITKGTATYLYTGEWSWSYKQGSSTITKQGAGSRISFTAPAYDKISGGITVSVYYDVEPTKVDEITLRVIMVSSNGTIIDEISTEKVNRSQSINKSITSPKSVNGVSYVYMNKWDYTYNSSAGAKTVAGIGTKATFTIPAATTMGTVVILKIYYDASQEVEVPEASEPIIVPLDSPSPYGVINGDSYSSPYFDSEKGIPTTESQYVYVKTKDYLLGYTLVNRTGVVTYNVPVKKHYKLEYYSATPDNPKLVEDTVTDVQYIEVERAYSYWEIEKLEYYYVNSANVYNYSLPNGSVTLNADGKYLNLPTLSTWHSSNLEDHVIPPIQVREGIEIWEPSPITSDTSDRPEIEFEDLTAYALTLTGEAKVKNDYLLFNETVVLSNSEVEKIAPSPNASPLKQSTTIIQDKTLFTENNVIDAIKANGVYSSTGSVKYKLHSQSVNASYSSRDYSINVNSVTIHTPVICEPVLAADNDKWVQLISPDNEAVQIVLDPDSKLNDFTVSISNTLHHSNRQGYNTRDYSRSFIDPANVSYIARKDGIVRNEVKFPFDVYVDILKDGKTDNDIFLKAGTWFVIGRDTYRFYVPMWVKEGIYTAEYRTIAVNGTDKLDKSETTRNADIKNYVATAKRTFQVSGRIYGLTIYDISDYPNWENVFRKENSMLFKYFEGATDGTTRSSYNKKYSYYYKVGTKDQYGKDTGRNIKYTFPLVNGSHPLYQNLGILKTGYAIRFMLDTTGEMYSSANYIKIIPTFYYVDADGGNRKQVDLYYDEEINGKQYNLVKVGEGVDLVNIESGKTGNIYTRIPETEITNTAKVMNTTYSKIANQTSTMYAYSIIKLLSPFRTFVGQDYANHVTSLASFNDVQDLTGETKTSLSKYMQRWYGTYKIPMNVHAVPAGYDVYGYMKKHGIDYKENFWLKNGYIIVNFNIITVDKNGKERLSYVNANNYLNNGNCSMWVTEGAPVQKTDSKGTKFTFRSGDVVIYYSDKKFSEDYEGNLY